MKKNDSVAKKERLSGIELLKIFAIFIIVISHVVQTLSSYKMGIVGYADYYISLSGSFVDTREFILVLCRLLGMLGNTIFFLCSAWFLVDVKKPNIQKLLAMVFDVFIISIIWLGVLLIDKGYEVIGKENIIRSLLPLIKKNNWYVSLYIPFALLSPVLNYLINKLNKDIHLAIGVATFFLMFVVAFFRNVAVGTVPFVWVSMYILVAYLKKYGMKLCDNILLNVVLLIIGIVGAVYFLSRVNSNGKAPLDYFVHNNVFHFVIALSSLNLCRQLKFRSKFINYISSLSLLAYIIHENILFRDYYRGYIWHLLYVRFGFNHLLVIVFSFSLVLFIAALLISAAFKESIARLTQLISKAIYSLLVKLWNIVSRPFLKKKGTVQA